MITLDQLLERVDALQREFDRAWEISEREDYVDSALRSHCLVPELVAALRDLMAENERLEALAEGKCTP